MVLTPTPGERDDSRTDERTNDGGQSIGPTSKVGGCNKVGGLKKAFLLCRTRRQGRKYDKYLADLDYQEGT